MDTRLVEILKELRFYVDYCKGKSNTERQEKGLEIMRLAISNPSITLKEARDAMDSSLAFFSLDSIIGLGMRYTAQKSKKRR